MNDAVSQSRSTLMTRKKVVCNETETENDELLKIMSKFWAIEKDPEWVEKQFSARDNEVLDFFYKTTEYDTREKFYTMKFFYRNELHPATPACI